MAGENSRDTSTLNNALVHLYRAEVARADAWRTRLDNTTNWALTTSAAVLSFGLGTQASSHAVLLAGMYLVINFLLIEARRYRTWDVYLRRVRLLETGLYAPVLRNQGPDGQQLRELALMLDSPRIVVSFWSAIGQRIKRAYGPVLAVLLVAWLFKLVWRQEPTQSVGQFIGRMHVGTAPGWAVLIAVALTYLMLGASLAWSLWQPPPPTELLALRRRRPRPLREAFHRPARPLAPPVH